MKKEDLPEPQPLTLAELEAHVGEIEDKAWLAQADAHACKFVLGNLLAVLHGAGAMDVGAFIDRLLAYAPHMDSGQERQGVQGFPQEMKLHLASAKGSAGEGSPGGVFH